MPTGSIWLIIVQKVFKTQSVKSMEQHYFGSNQWVNDDSHFSAQDERMP